MAMHRTEEAVKKTINDMNTGKADGSLEPEFVSYDEEKTELIMRFPVRDWMLNSKNAVHGMIVCGWLDAVMGMLSNDVTQDVFAPTGSMYMNFISAVPAGETVLATAKVITGGRRLIRMQAEARIESSGKLAANAEGTYIPVTYKKSDAMKAEDEKKR